MEAGMSYSEARARVVRISDNPKIHPQAKENLCRSIINQVKVRSGEGSARELVKSVSSRH